MQKKEYAALAALQLCILIFIARYQTIPGNIDADYYFMGGVRLAQGYGFTENFIWNYFNDPTSLPQPSHAYWMPLGSILAALGMWLTGEQTFASGRLIFMALATFIPSITGALAYRITSRRELAILSGLFALCSGFYLPYLPITENYGVFMILGALYFLHIDRADKKTYFILGLLSGLLSLARSDGMLWLLLTILLIITRLRDDESFLSKPKLASASIDIFLTLSGFLIVMLPWYLRNLEVFGAPISAAARRAFWLTEYYQTFIYPADQLNISNWLVSGWGAIIVARLQAFQRILFNVVVVQSAFILLPFILLGIWKMRASLQVRWGMIAWALLIFVFTVIFPFASARGSYIHAVAAIQPLVWIFASVGFDSFLQFLQKRQSFQSQSVIVILQFAFISMLAFISYSSVSALVFASNGWQRGELTYPNVEKFLLQQNIKPDEPVMVTNPPGYVMMTGRPSVMFPYGGEESILGVAERFGARYIALNRDPVNPNAHFNALYADPDLYASIKLIGQVGDVLVFKVVTLP